MLDPSVAFRALIKVTRTVPDSIQRRERYRLTYPLQARPRMRVGDQQWPIIEISEDGGRTLAGPIEGACFDAGAKVLIEFQSGQQVAATASLIRLEQDVIVLRFRPSIPLRVITAEQRWLLERYSKDQLRPSSGR